MIKHESVWFLVNNFTRLSDRFFQLSSGTNEKCRSIQWICLSVDLTGINIHDVFIYSELKAFERSRNTVAEKTNHYGSFAFCTQNQTTLASCYFSE